MHKPRVLIVDDSKAVIGRVNALEALSDLRELRPLLSHATA